jgi:hypothetical protein
MRVVFLTTHEARTSVGGVEQHVASLSAALVRHGVEVWVFVPRFGQARATRTREEMGVHVEELTYPTKLVAMFSWLDRHAGSGIRLAFGLLAKLKYNVIGASIARDVLLLSPDILHQHDFLAGLRASRIIGRHVPVVLTNHTGEYLLLTRTTAGRQLLRQLLARYRFIIGPSRELTPPVSNASYIANGVDLRFFRVPGTDTREAARRALGISERQVLMLCPRRWAPTKGVLYLAQAIVALPGDVAKRCTFIFAGSGNDGYPVYRRQVGDVLVNAHNTDVRVVGDLNQEQLREVYYATDVTVIPSLLEATSLAALESLACGIPVLATNVGGLPDIVEEGKNGWLVPAGDRPALAAAIVSLVRSADLIADAKKVARASVEGRFSWDTVAEDVLSVYESVLGREPST